MATCTFPWGSLSSINCFWIAWGKNSKSCRDWALSFFFHRPPSSTASWARISFSSAISCWTCNYPSSIEKIISSQEFKLKWRFLFLFSKFHTWQLREERRNYLWNEVNETFRYKYDTIIITELWALTDYIHNVVGNIFECQLLQSNLSQTTGQLSNMTTKTPVHSPLYHSIGRQGQGTSSPIIVMFGWVCRAHSKVMWEAARPINLTTAVKTQEEWKWWRQ